MPTIERRLDALEAKLMTEPNCTTMWIRFVEPGELEAPARRIWQDTQEWYGQDGESEEALKNRAEAEAVLQPGHSGLLMLME